MTDKIRVDQENGELTLRTGRQGVGSKVGHDLTIRVGQWSAEATVDGNVVFDLRVVADLTSLQVVTGDGGLKPLTDKDRKTILSNAADTLGTRAHPELVFVSSVPHRAEGTNTLTGDLTLAGVTKSQQLAVLVTGRAVLARGEVKQTDFGIKPYSGLLGALKVRDMVEIQAEVELPAS
ncbi:MAG: YceI family protein [Frankiales bacterium]|nr:YceI family protein [Frankiales bacterium]